MGNDHCRTSEMGVTISQVNTEITAGNMHIKVPLPCDLTCLGRRCRHNTGATRHGLAGAPLEDPHGQRTRARDMNEFHVGTLGIHLLVKHRRVIKIQAG